MSSSYIPMRHHRPELVTVKELKKQCRVQGYRNYSLLRKSELIKLCMEGKHPRGASPMMPLSYTGRAGLIAQCKARGLRGCSKATMKQLVGKLRAPSPRSPAGYTKAQLLEKAKAANIPNRHRMTKDELWKAVYVFSR